MGFVIIVIEICYEKKVNMKKNTFTEKEIMDCLNALGFVLVISLSYVLHKFNLF